MGDKPSEWEIVNGEVVNDVDDDKPIDDLHLIMILDESGSMGGIRNDIIGSVNTMIEEQQKLKVDRTKFTFIKFNTNFVERFSKVPLSTVKVLTHSDYVPNGGTALYDAVGNALNKYSDDKNVCVFIVTDGEENSSKEFSHKVLMEYIERKKNDGWKFIYLSSDIKASAQGASLGLHSAANGCKNTCTQNKTVQYKFLSQNIRNECNYAISELRTNGKMKGMGN